MACKGVAIYYVKTIYGYFELCHSCHVKGHMQGNAEAGVSDPNAVCQCEHKEHG